MGPANSPVPMVFHLSNEACFKEAILLTQEVSIRSWKLKFIYSQLLNKSIRLFQFTKI